MKRSVYLDSVYRVMNKKEEILKKGAELFIAKGYRNTSIDDITKACGITKGALYYHFKNKDEVFYHIVVVILDEIAVWMEKKTQQQESTEELISVFFNLNDYFSYSKYYDNLNTNMYNIIIDVVKLYPEMKKKFSESLFRNMPNMVETIMKSQKRGEILENYQPEALAMMIIYSVEGLLFVSAISGEESSIIEKSRYMGENLWRSIKA